MKHIKKIIIILIVVVALVVGAVLGTNQSPTFMTYQPAYKAGEEVTAFDLLTDCVVDLKDDRTANEDLEVIVLKNGIEVKDLQSDTIDTTNPDSNTYEVKVTDSGMKSVSEVLYYSVA